MIQKRYEEIISLPCEIRLVLRRHAFDGFLIKSRTIYDHELVFVIGGAGVFTVEGREYPAVPGTLFYFYPGLVHQCETRGPDHVRFYAVHFSFHYGDGNKDCRLPLEPMSALSNIAEVKGLFAQLLQAWKAPDVSHIWRSNTLLEQLILELLTTQRNSSITDANHNRGKQAAAYIEDHFRENLTISRLCSCIGVKEATLYRIFRDVWGESPMDYVTRRRIAEAQELLYTENYSVEQVGQMVGIDDPYYFSRLFRKWTGVSPRNYRTFFQK